MHRTDYSIAGETGVFSTKTGRRRASVFQASAWIEGDGYNKCNLLDTSDSCDARLDVNTSYMYEAIEMYFEYVGIPSEIAQKDEATHASLVGIFCLYNIDRL